MKRKIMQRFIGVMGLLALVLSACNQAPQVSGIVAVSHIETVACQGRDKTLQIRNQNTSEPQRIQGVYFELGTNEDKYFKILEVSANGQTKQAVSNLVEEIILPPGGVMEVKVNYNPKKTTAEGEYHDTYLDVFLNGPTLGIMQIELRGTAPTALEGCTDAPSTGRTFQVTAAKTILSHTGLGAPVETDLDVSTSVQGNLILSGDDSAVSIPTDGWPVITFPLPDGAPIPELTIQLEEDTPTADFSSGSLTIDGVVFSVPAVGSFTDLTLTTGSITIDSSVAPNVSGGSLNLTGSDLNGSGEMTLVVAAPLVNPLLDGIENVGGGVFAMEISFKEIQ